MAVFLLFLSGISVSAQDWIVTSNADSSLVIGRDKRYDLLVASNADSTSPARP